MKRGVRHLTAVCIAVLATCASVTAAGAVDLTYRVEKVVRAAGADGGETVQLTSAEAVVEGDELVYTIVFTNRGSEPVAAGGIVVTNPLPDELAYVDGTAAGVDTEIAFSIDDGGTFAAPDALEVSQDGVSAPAPSSAYTTIRWTYQPELAPGAASEVSFHARVE